MSERSTEKAKFIKTIASWLRRWNKLLAAFIAFLFFATVFIVTIVEIYLENTSTNENVTTDTVNVTNSTYPYERDRQIDNTCDFEDNYCTVRCSQMSNELVSIRVNELNFSACTTPGQIKLVLNDIYFTNNVVSNGWLDGLSKDVVELTISSPTLTQLGESAFGGSPFSYLNSLVISSSLIRVLKRESFLNSKLQSFEFRCNNPVETEEDALGAIADYLVILQFSQCIDNIIAVKNVTGTSASVFNKLIELDLRYNTFNTLLNDTFSSAPKLVSLYLSENNLNEVEVNAFRGIQDSVQLISLQNNKLTTLPEGVFDNFHVCHEIDISGNRWNCNCDLLWLKQFYINNLDAYFRNGLIPFICTAGNYSEVDFCPGTSTTENDYSDDDSETTTTQIPTATTTANPYDYVYLECNDLTLAESSLETLNRIFSHSTKVRNGSVVYNFYQIGDTPNFEMKLLNSIGSDYIIWINSKNSSDYGCVHNVQEIVQLNNLQYGDSYTICLLKEAQETVTPFDCTSLNVPLEWKNLAWIQNKYIPVVIGGIVGSSLAIILITSLIIFYTIRQNPKLIKGNKRVVIVRNKSADALVMPNYERQPYSPPSVYTNSEGYLTPRHKMYDKVNERRFRHLNTITEKFYRDLYNNSRTSYHTESLHRRSVASGVYEAPPLPPNHPCERAKISPSLRPHSSTTYNN